MSIRVDALPPIVDAGNDTTVSVNDTVYLHGTAEDNEEIVGYAWKTGDGEWVETSSGDTFAIAPAVPTSSYVCSLRATDDDEMEGTDYMTISVYAGEPTAHAGNDTTVSLNDTVYLYGTGEDNGEIVGFAWKMGDGDWVETSTGDTIAIAPSSPTSSFICSLRVTDDDGMEGTDFVTLNVYAGEPTCYAGWDTTVSIKDTVFLHGTATDNGSIEKWEWRWGAKWRTSSTADTFVVVPSVTTTVWVCSLRVTDDDGMTAVDSRSIAVKSMKPTVNAGPDQNVSINDTVLLHGTVTDNGTIAKYEWDLGDGVYVECSTPDTFVVAPSSPTDSYACKFRATDDDGMSRYDGVKITATDLAPIVSAGNDTTVGIGTEIHLHASAQDDGGIITYEWSFGNSNWVQTSTSDTTIIAPLEEGYYACAARVTDDEGRSSGDAISVLVARFTARAIDKEANGALSVCAIDIDRDGDMDVLSASYYADAIRWYENDGRGEFTVHTIYASANGAASVFAVDVDGDGDIDVLSASELDHDIRWYENDGSQGFTPRPIYGSAKGAYSVCATDMDGDGDVDVLSASRDDDDIRWYENDGYQGFTARAIYGTANGACSGNRSRPFVQKRVG